MSVEVTIDAGVAEITLNWADRGNALGPDEARSVRLAIETLNTEPSDEPEISAVVLSAAGKAFCAGGDLKAISKLAEGGERAVREAVYTEFQGLFRALRGCPFPLIAAVDGPAVGLGADLALATDSVFIGANGWFRQGWLAIGLIPAPGGLFDLQRRSGRDAVWRFAAAARISPPEREAPAGPAISCTACDLAMPRSAEGRPCPRCGLTLRTRKPDAVVRAAALTLARHLARQPRDALLAMKRLINIPDLDHHLDVALSHQVGFLTDPGFAARAAELLNKAGRRA